MTNGQISLGDCSVDLELHEARRGEERISLSANEVALLRFLLAAGGEPVSKERLQVEVLGYSPRTVSRAADYAVHRLRKKLERDPADPEHLLTIPGVGYRLVTGAPAPAEAPAPGPASHNLPAQTTSFVGREAELADALALLEGGARLLSLVGPGGAGKTRLSLRLAAAWCEARSEPVRFCELSQATDAATFCAGVAGALGVGGSSAARVGAALASRAEGGAGRLLLVLDNLEQVIGPAAEAAAAWLAAAPGLRIVATTRERLRLPGEHLIEVGPLDVDEAAPRLFIERARMARPGFRADTPADRETVRRLVARLDGLPLAIELTASRSLVLSPRQMLAHLEREQDVGRAARGVPARHTSVERAIAWSWALLSPDEQAALAQLSVFRGGFDVDAAEAVVRGVEAPALELVQSLREKSLLIARPGDDAPRFGFLVSVRDFARGRCEDRDGAWLRHAAWVVARTREAAEDSLYEDKPAPPALRREWSNLGAAIRRLEALGDRPALFAEAVAAAMTRAAELSEREAYLALLGRALEAPGLEAALRLRLLLTRAFFSRVCARTGPEARADCARAAALARDLGRPEDAALAQLILASLLNMADEPEASWAALEQARADLEGQPPGSLYIRVEIISSNNCISQGRLEASRAHLRRALERSAQAGVSDHEALILSNLAYLSSRTGDHAEQARLARRALLRCRALGALGLERRTLLWLAMAEAELGQLDEALRHGHDILALCADTPEAAAVCEALITLAGVELARGELEEMERLVRLARERAANLRAPWHSALIDQWEALACWARWGSLERASALLERGAALAGPHLPQARIFLEGKRLAARAHLALEEHAQIALAMDQLEADAAALGRPDLAAPIQVDRAHLSLALAARAADRGEDPSPHLGPVRAQLFEGALDVASQGFGVVCSRWLLASLYAELEHGREGERRSQCR
jgi:predicted ATPase/DNA-binding winged helix-turn-helix (wHTH) protein